MKGCRVIIAGKNMVAWECSFGSGDPLAATLITQSDARNTERENELDLDIERELGRWPSMNGETESADIEYVPAELLGKL